ncbi:unnamed protein product [Adineta steineri]|uniref:Uncharacterized protein n=1 Tax=Adineta steineri TaxID=433720 RepID=A0A813MQ99_9BILA|nr:unnamed protein product [Adineta steineri]CAF1319000.1 unnamed protein product [Adineta steineri]
MISNQMLFIFGTLCLLILTTVSAAPVMDDETTPVMDDETTPFMNDDFFKHDKDDVAASNIDDHFKTTKDDVFESVTVDNVVPVKVDRTVPVKVDIAVPVKDVKEPIIVPDVITDRLLFVDVSVNPFHKDVKMDGGLLFDKDIFPVTLDAEESHLLKE